MAKYEIELSEDDRKNTLDIFEVMRDEEIQDYGQEDENTQFYIRACDSLKEAKPLQSTWRPIAELEFENGKEFLIRNEVGSSGEYHHNVAGFILWGDEPRVVIGFDEYSFEKLKNDKLEYMEIPT